MLRPDANASSPRRRPSTKIEAGSLPSRTARARRSRELSRLAIFVDFTSEQFATETQRHRAKPEVGKGKHCYTTSRLSLIPSVLSSPCLCASVAINPELSLPKSASDRKHSKAGPRPNAPRSLDGQKSNPHESVSPRLATSACRSETG